MNDTIAHQLNLYIVWNITVAMETNYFINAILLLT